jgi:hypothetical protein
MKPGLELCANSSQWKISKLILDMLSKLIKFKSKQTSLNRAIFFPKLLTITHHN